MANETTKCIVTNPLSWTSTPEKISRKKNSGSVLKNFNALKKRVASAQVHGNILWSCKPKFIGNFMIRTKNYHIGDINLYYLSIRNNVKNRLQAYLKK